MKPVTQQERNQQRNEEAMRRGAGLPRAHPRDRRTDRPLSPLDRLKLEVVRRGGAIIVDTYETGQRVTVEIGNEPVSFTAEWTDEPSAAKQALDYVTNEDSGRDSRLLTIEDNY